MAKQKILIVDDEEKIVEIVMAYLTLAGFETVVAYDGESALIKFKESSPDLIILDLMLPKLSGELVCKKIRETSDIPIIMLTAKVTENDLIFGLRIGADDYITKPFRAKELVARVETLLRRAKKDNNILTWNNELTIDIEGCRVFKSEKEIKLTPNEFKLLTALAKNPKKTFTREELIENAFGNDYEGFDRTIDSHIKNLRAKIETTSDNPCYIITVRGIGYRFGG